MATITLRPGRERPVIQRHPWVFSGAIDSVRGDPVDGEPVDVLAPSGDWLARGLWSGSSQIRARLCTWDPNQHLDDEWLRDGIARAVSGRAGLADGEGGACRLVFSESDGLPGLIVDRYGDYLTVQIVTQGMEARRGALIRALADLLAPRGIYERSDADMREKEGLPPAEGLIWGEEPPAQIVVRPAAAPGSPVPPPHLIADLRAGQKTGTYLDQSINRARVAAYCRGADVLDCFCYSGGFSAYAARAGATGLTLIDSSLAALDMARQNLDLNEIATPADYVEGNVFKVLRAYRAEGRRFDVIVLDPPKFAQSQGQVNHATRGYKDINWLAMQLLRPGGTLATFSCSGLISPDLFQKVVFGASVDAKRDVQIIERLGQSPDHPILLTFPESEYLKGFVCRVW
ncbi:class I SAM-dependent methyltransferase [Oscillochloris sp. ZM17-4]|uniref:class I SAM-dependent rRNA methyltransferase n=1 Tax=Oscillochloris sp. ZM17-4 TaxID=2866714 RepID=UPI001C72FC6A|nr:class I SAM-dependent methyltransferase [Oscillochloris sp. ZM17-4]MBX0330338.1 class I SAM-dependent methyltransferase [Oscillochloris sp. ZM17-4]